MADEVVLAIPNLILSQHLFTLTQPSLTHLHDNARTELLNGIKAESMAPYYKIICSTSSTLPVDQALLQSMEKANEEELARLDERLAEAEKTEGETEISDALKARANYFTRIGDKDKAVEAQKLALEKTPGLGSRIDIVLTLVRIGFFFGDHDLITSNLTKAEALIDEGGDWDRRNRLKVYTGLRLISIRQFKRGGELFADALSTFTATELLSYNDFVALTVIANALTLGRVELKKKIINAPEVNQVLPELPILGELIRSLYDCHYDKFFIALATLEQTLLLPSRILSPHARYYVREMRVLAYSQLLESYRSLTLESLSAAFGVSVDFVDSELSRFIANGRLHCSIDKVHAIVETTRPSLKHAQYEAVVKQGDFLDSAHSMGRAPGSSKKPRAKKTTEGVDDVLRSQVLALGGTEDDISLVKGAGAGVASGAVNDDPSLAKDVSSFLQGLNLGGTESTVASKPSKSKKQKEVKGKDAKEQEKAEKRQEKTTKKQKKVAPEPATPPAVVEEAPKVQLPSKVTFSSKSSFVFQPTALWHTALPLSLQKSTPAITPDLLSSLFEKAATLHAADTRTFQSSSSSSEASFLSKIIQSGTLSDRLSALTLLVQSSPVHNTKALETLRGMAERGKGKGGREESLKALRCVVDWWVGGGAPERKLRYFRDQVQAGATDEMLVVWYFEDWLKKYFFSILQILETLSLDPLPYVRTQALTLIFTLLRDKPEQEQNLLRLLVNKLGDTEKSLCSRASYHLLQLLQTHPSMKAVVVREIIALVLRPPASSAAASLASSVSASTPSQPTNKHIRFTDANDAAPQPKQKSKPATTTREKKPTNTHARYYATITCNQIVLTPAPGDRDVALRLIDVYFEMFKEILGEGEGPNLTTDDDGGDGDGQDALEKDGEVVKDRKGRVVVRGGKGAKGKGKGKGKNGAGEGGAGFVEAEDANSKLTSAILTGVNRALPFARIDVGDVGISNHIDTLFLITHTSTFNISLQALVLIQQISATLASPSSATPTTTTADTKAKSISRSIIDRYYRTLYDSLLDPRLACSSKQAMYLNLLFKSIKADAGSGAKNGTENIKGERVKALVRRFVQVLVSGGSGATEVVAGGLYLLGELFSTIPGLRAVLNSPSPAHAESKSKSASEETTPYDPRKRDPQYAHASSSPMWELTPLLHHYHPSVSLHARQLLTAVPLTASPDLAQNTLAHFLDRFVYKNPKKSKVEPGAGLGAVGKAKGGSAMQPSATGLDGSGTGVKLVKGEVGEKDGRRMNEGAFLGVRVEDVPVDQLFYHKYFSRKREKEKRAGKRRGEDEGSDGDEEDEEEQEGDEEDEGAGKGDVEEEEEERDSDEDEEAEIWKAMQRSMPKAAGEDSDLMEDSDADVDDDDELPSDFDLDMEDDDDESQDEGAEDEFEDENDDEDDALSLVEGSDNEDLISLNGDVPDGLIDWDGSDGGKDEDEDGEWGGIGDGNKKRKRDETLSGKRKKIKALPTFASYEDYAKMIEEGPEDDI
ncbi:hypothetical protein H0H92_010385 [Tricholoma furcatifolium]|nr:hypothetical protein H0H92_010385 [Tricholoma furcatifolium]